MHKSKNLKIMITNLTVTKYYYYLIKKNMESIVPFCYTWYHFKEIWLIMLIENCLESLTQV